MSIASAYNKARFIARWYGLYNFKLILLQLRMPEAADKALPKEAALLLDQRRRKAQTSIYRIVGKYGEVCAECGGRCCMEEIDRYTPFDQQIHGPLDRPLESYSGKIFSPFWMIKNGFKHQLDKVKGSNLAPPPCRYLSPAGCSLEKDMRPMLCASWFCPSYMRSLEDNDLIELEKHLAQVETIHVEVAKLSR